MKVGENRFAGLGRKSGTTQTTSSSKRVLKIVLTAVWRIIQDKTWVAPKTSSNAMGQLEHSTFCTQDSRKALLKFADLIDPLIEFDIGHRPWEEGEVKGEEKRHVREPGETEDPIEVSG